MIRELRELFRRNERGIAQQNEPQNIWEGNYFRDLDEYIEEDNLRIRQVVEQNRQQEVVEIRNNPEIATLRDEMLAELNRLREIMMGAANPNPISNEVNNRDKEFLYKVLEEMDVHLSLVKQVIFIHKKFGMFEINLNNADVHFIPSTCLGCEYKCPSRKRHICIVRQENANEGYSLILNDDPEIGWNDGGLGAIDLLILSKAIALENSLLPGHVINQISNSLNCNVPDVANSFTPRPCDRNAISQLRKLMLQELTGHDDNNMEQPPIPRAGLRNLIIDELRELFGRARIRQEAANEDLHEA